MKKITKAFAVIASLAAIFSCDKEIESPVNPAPEQSGDMVEMTIIASGAVDEGNKTAISGNNVVWNSTGEYLKVFQDMDGTVTYADSSEGATTDEGATMTFGVSFAAASGTSFKYFAFYPKSAYIELKGGAFKVKTPATQTPTATSFDPAADLLVAKMVDNGGEQATSLNMQFARAVAVGKMTITNLGSDEDVKKVTFSAKKESASVTLAGRSDITLGANKPETYGTSVPETAIHLDYSALSLKANTSMDAFFTCYPFDLVAGDSFTVEVQTESKTFTRVVNLTGAQKLSFKPGTASRFSVNMSTADEVDNAVDLCYASLTASEYLAARETGTGYKLTTVSKTHGDKWLAYASNGSSSIQIRDNSSDNDSYLKLPEFVDDIKTVVVSLTSAIAANKYLTLESAADSNNGSIASITTTAGTLSYTFDLTSKTVKTAYLRINGAVAYVSKVEVYAGDDTRAKVASPTGVTASLSGTNGIAITWTKAVNAVGYEIICTPQEGEATVVATGDVATYTVEGLANYTTYTITIASIPDYYLYKKSDAIGSSPSTITTSKSASYILTAIQNSSNNTTTKIYETTIGGKLWSAPGNQNKTGYWLIGGTSTNCNPADRVIYSKEVITTDNVRQVVIETDGVDKVAVTVNSTKLEVYDTLEHLNAGGEEGRKAVFTNTDSDWARNTEKIITFTKVDSQSWSSCYYRITFNISNSSTTTYGLMFKKATFYD